MTDPRSPRCEDLPSNALPILGQVRALVSIVARRPYRNLTNRPDPRRRFQSLSGSIWGLRAGRFGPHRLGRNHSQCKVTHAICGRPIARNDSLDRLCRRWTVDYSEAFAQRLDLSHTEGCASASLGSSCISTIHLFAVTVSRGFCTREPPAEEW